MSADRLDDHTRPHRTADALDDALPEWVLLIGLHDPRSCAARLARALVDDPFDLVSFTSIVACHFGASFPELVDLLGRHEPSLRTALVAVAAAMPRLEANDHLSELSESETAALPAWLRAIDDLECSGVMRRYDYPDRSASSYLIEVRMADGQRATARLAISHRSGDSIAEFSTTCFSLDEAARFYRKRYAAQTPRPYRHVNAVTACRRIVEAVAGSVRSGALETDVDAPTPWPQNLPVLELMLRAAMKTLSGDGRALAPK